MFHVTSHLQRRDGRIRTGGLLVPGQADWPRFPTSRPSQGGRIRTGGLKPPELADCQAFPRPDGPAPADRVGGPSNEKARSSVTPGLGDDRHGGRRRVSQEQGIDGPAARRSIGAVARTRTIVNRIRPPGDHRRLDCVGVWEGSAAGRSRPRPPVVCQIDAGHAADVRTRPRDFPGTRLPGGEATVAAGGRRCILVPRVGRRAPLRARPLTQGLR